MSLDNPKNVNRNQNVINGINIENNIVELTNNYIVYVNGSQTFFCIPLRYII